MVIMVLAGFAIVFFYVAGRTRPRSSTPRISGISRSPAEKNDFASNAREAAETPDIGSTSAVIPVLEKEKVPAAKSHAVQYRVIGNGGYPAKVVDGLGNVLLEATLDFSIHAVSEAPDGAHLLVSSYPMGLIIDTVSKNKVPLPTYPPGKDKLGFSSWAWLDGNTVLGVSGDAVTARKAGVEGEGNNVAQTRLYVFNLKNGSLQEVNLDEVSTKVFAVTEVRPGGYVHLVHDDATGEGDLGWFQVGRR